jgi:hypothetical protein
MGIFSSDRAIAEYAEQIWHARPVALAFPAVRRGLDRRVREDQAQRPTAA